MLDHFIVWGMSLFACLSVLTGLKALDTQQWRPAKVLAPLFALVDACLILASWHAELPFFLFLLCLFLPLALILEYWVMAKGKLWTCLGYYAVIQFVMLSAWEIANSAVLLFMNRRSQLAGLMVTFLLFGGAFQIPQRAKTFPRKEIAQIFRSKTSGALILIYLLNTILAVFLSQIVMMLLISQPTLETLKQPVILLSRILKDLSIILGGCLSVRYLIQFQRGTQKQRDTERMLEYERSIRTMLYQDCIFSYCANITKDSIEEGYEYFVVPHCAVSTSYLENLHRVAKEAVHPEDLWKFSEIDSAYHQERMENNPLYETHFRVSPQKILAATNLPPRVQSIFRSAKTDWMWVAFRVALTHKPGSGDLMAYVYMADINDMVTQRMELQAAAACDSMTHLLNRRAFEQTIQDALGQGRDGAMFMIDIDHFKEVNDHMGHQAGDDLICGVADLLRSVFRDSDIIGRMGGDEFGVFVPGLINREALGQRASELVGRCMSVRAREDGTGIPITLSIGIAVAPEDGTSYEVLYQNADQALYRSKRSGRNQYSFFSSAGAAVNM